MTGIRLASDERWLTGGLAIVVWASALVAFGLLFSGGAHRSATPTVATAPPADVDPVATLPPTLVVAARTDGDDAGCARASGRDGNGRRCTAALQAEGDPRLPQ